MDSAENLGGRGSRSHQGSRAGPPRSFGAAMREHLGIAGSGTGGVGGVGGTRNGWVGVSGFTRGSGSQPTSAPPYNQPHEPPQSSTASWRSSHSRSLSEVDSEEPFDFPTPTPRHRALPWGVDSESPDSQVTPTATHSQGLMNATSSDIDTPVSSAPSSSRMTHWQQLVSPHNADNYAASTDATPVSRTLTPHSAVFGEPMDQAETWSRNWDRGWGRGGPVAQIPPNPPNPSSLATYAFPPTTSSNPAPRSLSPSDPRTSLDSSRSAEAKSVVTRSDADEDDFQDMLEVEQDHRARERSYEEYAEEGYREEFNTTERNYASFYYKALHNTSNSPPDSPPAPTLAISIPSSFTGSDPSTTSQAFSSLPPAPPILNANRLRSDPISPARIAVVAHQQRAYAPPQQSAIVQGDQRQQQSSLTSTVRATAPVFATTSRANASAPGVGGAGSAASGAPSLRALLATVSDADVRAAAQVAASWHLSGGKGEAVVPVGSIGAGSATVGSGETGVQGAPASHLGLRRPNPALGQAGAAASAGLRSDVSSSHSAMVSAPGGSRSSSSLVSAASSGTGSGSGFESTHVGGGVPIHESPALSPQSSLRASSITTSEKSASSRPPSVRLSSPQSANSSPSKTSPKTASVSASSAETPTTRPASSMTGTFYRTPTSSSSQGNDSESVDATQPQARMDPTTAFENLLAHMPPPSSDTLLRSARAKALLARRYELVAVMTTPGPGNTPPLGYNPLKVARWRQQQGRVGKGGWLVGVDDVREWWEEVGSRPTGAVVGGIEFNDVIVGEAGGNEESLGHSGRTRREDIAGTASLAAGTVTAGGVGVGLPSSSTPSSPASPQAATEVHAPLDQFGALPQSVVGYSAGIAGIGRFVEGDASGEPESVPPAQSLFFQKFLSGTLPGQGLATHPLPPAQPVPMGLKPSTTSVASSADAANQIAAAGATKSELRNAGTDIPVASSSAAAPMTASVTDLRPLGSSGRPSTDDPRSRKRSVSSDSATGRTVDRRSRAFASPTMSDGSKMKRTDSGNNMIADMELPPGPTPASSSRGSIDMLGGMWPRGRTSPTTTSSGGEMPQQPGFFGGLFGRRRTRRDGAGSDGGSALAIATIAAEQDPEVVVDGVSVTFERDRSPGRDDSGRKSTVDRLVSPIDSKVVAAPTRRSASVSGTGAWRLADMAGVVEWGANYGKAKDKEAIGRPPSTPIKIADRPSVGSAPRSPSNGLMGKPTIGGSPLSVGQTTMASSGSVSTSSSTSPSTSLSGISERKKDHDTEPAQVFAASAQQDSSLAISPGGKNFLTHRSSSDTAVSESKASDESRGPQKHYLSAIPPNLSEPELVPNRSVQEGKPRLDEDEGDRKRGRKEKRREGRGVGLMVPRKTPWNAARRRDKVGDGESRDRSSSRDSNPGSAFSKTKGKVVQSLQKARNAFRPNRNIAPNFPLTSGMEPSDELQATPNCQDSMEDTQSVGSANSSSLKRVGGHMSLAHIAGRKLFTSELQEFLRDVHSTYATATPTLLDSSVVLTPHARKNGDYVRLRNALVQLSTDIPEFLSRLRVLEAKLLDLQSKDLDLLTKHVLSGDAEFRMVPPSVRSDSGSAMNIIPGSIGESLALDVTKVMEFNPRADRTGSGSTDLTAPNQSFGRTAGQSFWTPATSLQRNSDPTLASTKIPTRELQEIYLLVTGYLEKPDSLEELITNVGMSTREIGWRAEELQRQNSVIDNNMSDMISQVKKVTQLVNQEWLVRLKLADDELRKVESFRGTSSSDWMWAFLGVVLTLLGSIWYYGYMVYKRVSLVAKAGSQQLKAVWHEFMSGADVHDVVQSTADQCTSDERQDTPKTVDEVLPGTLQT
ncbi:hypothetical protein HDU93_001449 [Gonapodya sp. JEL0774]|nr:hypothetical protein HDU93_001449 [Gonapodya sp. JEL0774]